MSDTEITDDLVSTFEAAYLAELYPNDRDLVLSPPGTRHFKSYRAGLQAVMSMPPPPAREATPIMWIVVNIGCIECAVSSNVVGLFADKDQADALARRLHNSHGWREGGQNHFEVFPLPDVGVIAPEYLKPATD